MLAASALRAQPPATADPGPELRKGKTFLATTVFSEDEDAKLLAL